MTRFSSSMRRTSSSGSSASSDALCLALTFSMKYAPARSPALCTNAVSTLITWLTDSHGLIRGVSASVCGAMGGGGGGDEGIFGQMSSLELASPILSMNAPAMTEGAR